MTHPNRWIYRVSILSLFFLASQMTGATASDALNLLMGPDVEEFRIAGHASSTFYTETDTDDAQNERFDLSIHNMGSAFPIMMRKHLKLVGSLDYKHLKIDTDARFPEMNRSVPGSLEDIQFALAGRTELANGWLIGGEFRIGSASDKLFNSEDELTFGGTFFMRMPSSGRNAWYFFLDADNRRDDLPVLPGFGFMLADSEEAWALIGLPFMMAHYQPMERISVDLKYRLLRDLHLRTTVNLTESVDFFAAFDWNANRFNRADRDDESDQIQYIEKTLSAGLTYQFHDNFSLELVAGYSFDRSLFEAEDYGNRNDNEIDIDGAAFGTLNLEYRF
ncbi:MAG: hypothetical protein ACYTGH_02040 [Planctomycetota bacterium]